MLAAEPISSIDPRAFVAQVRAKRAERIEASIAAWRTWMQSKLDVALGLSDVEIDKRADYFAWLFPLSERSRSAPLAPVIKRDVLRSAIQADPRLRLALVKAWRRGLQFYGLSIIDDRIDWVGARLWWARKASPHDRKISRMLRCMHCAGVTEQSRMLMDFLERECAGVAPRAEALAWWRSQLTG